MKLKAYSAGKTGLTLIEVMLSIIIIAVFGITAIASLFYPRLLAFTSASRRVAVAAATSKIEEIFATDYLLVPRGAWPTATLSDRYGIGDRTVTADVLVEESLSSDDYLYIRVDVSYPGMDTNNPVVLETYRSPMK